MIRKIALLGLTANPPTYGHIGLALTVLSSQCIDEVWIMPCNKHVNKEQIESNEHRIKMLEILTKPYTKIKVFDFEITNQLSGKMIETIELLKKSKMSSIFDFSLVIGEDNAINIKKWHRYQDLINNINFIVVARMGFESISNQWYHKEPHTYISEKTTYSDISSTIVRELLKDKNISHENKKEQIKNKISDELFDYIIRNKLYQK